MKQLIMIICLAACSIGCQTRSISNSGYHGTWGYRGELSELEVLGVKADEPITEADIHAALQSDPKVSLRRGDRVVVVQSGAQFPDEPLLEALESLYSVVPLSGVPAEDRRYRDRPRPVKQPLDKSLRLAAAKAGAKTLIVYWGVLESGREEQDSKIISWVPVVGRMVPDEKQKMRIRLKAAVIDVATGAWEFVIPEAYDDAASSARINREQSDQGQVTRLKAKGYEALAKALTARYR